MPIIFSDHAKFQLRRRGISTKLIKETILNPQSVVLSFRGRKLRRRRVGDKLLEVITKAEGSRIIIITAYYLE